MIQAILIDDEPLACSLLQEMLSDNPHIQVAAICHDGLSGLKKIQEINPDVVFLDIQMPKITGIEMLELLPDPPKVIFTTAYDEFAIKAFEINAIDYLLKPYSKERLGQAVDRLLNQPESNRKTTYQNITTTESSVRIVVKDGNTIKVIPTRDVMYLEAASDYVKVTTQDRYFLKHGTMQHFEDTLSASNFIRIHRSFLVNSEFISKIELYEKGGHCLILKNGSIVPVSKSGYSKLKSFLQ